MERTSRTLVSRPPEALRINNRHQILISLHAPIINILILIPGIHNHHIARPLDTENLKPIIGVRAPDQKIATLNPLVSREGAEGSVVALGGILAVVGVDSEAVAAAGGVGGALALEGFDCPSCGGGHFGWRGSGEDDAAGCGQDGEE